ncbi:hypothetical protein OAS39_13820 [Pirellulales bacterium]|nr:hypothetical protein [Pirellulales bacterium]
MSIFGRIRLWFVKRRLAVPRRYADELKSSSWRLGIVPEESRAEQVLTPADQEILAILEGMIQKTRHMKTSDDALDLAEALLIKGFILRIRGVGLSGLLGAAAQLNDSIKVCRTILDQVPAAEAVDILSQAALYTAELHLVTAEHEQVPQETRAEAKDEAQRYLEECAECSRRLENNERAKNANQLLARVHALT